MTRFMLCDVTRWGRLRRVQHVVRGGAARLTRGTPRAVHAEDGRGALDTWPAVSPPRLRDPRCAPSHALDGRSALGTRLRGLLG